MTDVEYAAKLREYAQSILGGVQRLEELGVRESDDPGLLETLTCLDADIWSVADYIEEGRPE